MIKKNKIMTMKIVATFNNFDDAKKYALDNVCNKQVNQVMVIIKQADTYYNVCRYDTDYGISMIVDQTQEFMRDYNHYIEGFVYYYHGWTDDCKLYIDINY